MEQTTIDQWVSKRLNGWSLREIADGTGYSHETVRYYLKKEMIEYRQTEIFKAFASIWREYMERGEDMTGIHYTQAIRTVAKEFKVSDVGAYKAIDKAVMREQKPTYLKQYAY
jgi:orotate phosphoribosyltransferase-like protein